MSEIRRPRQYHAKDPWAVKDVEAIWDILEYLGRFTVAPPLDGGLAVEGPWVGAGTLGTAPDGGLARSPAGGIGPRSVAGIVGSAACRYYTLAGATLTLTDADVTLAFYNLLDVAVPGDTDFLWDWRYGLRTVTGWACE